MIILAIENALLLQKRAIRGTRRYLVVSWTRLRKCASRLQVPTGCFVKPMYRNLLSSVVVRQ